MFALFHLVAAVALTIFQVTFLSHLTTPLSDISFPLLVIALAVFKSRPVKGALWALAGGLTLDIHGIFPFGTETCLLLLVFFLTHILFRRFITNTSLTAAFLLSTVVVALYYAGTVGIDGFRVLLGSDPFIIAQGSRVEIAFFKTAIANGLLTTALLAGWTNVRKRFAHRFIIRQ